LMLVPILSWVMSFQKFGSGSVFRGSEWRIPTEAYMKAQ
jgi:hypothetical protein